MRKNLLANVLEAPLTPHPDLNRHGAARSMTRSIEELAENSRRMQDGEIITSLDTDLIDGSFVSDRIAQNDENYDWLRAAIAAQGQSSPILVRPHPEREGRFMIVYGHRRARVARELGRPVRAVVKNIEDIAHIVAQGQENSARANLSFIEKALFAKKLLDMGQAKDTIKAALSIDDTLLSRMLSVSEAVPAPVIDAIGAAKGVGRDRWEDLKKLLAAPAKAQLAGEVVQSEEFLSREGAARFDFVLAQVRSGRKPAARKPAEPSYWVAPDKAVQAAYRRSGKSFSLSLSSKDGGQFGDFISANLERLYAEFRDARSHNE
jgi:ParB family chromosome partitioning protein